MWTRTTRIGVAFGAFVVVCGNTAATAAVAAVATSTTAADVIAATSAAVAIAAVAAVIAATTSVAGHLVAEPRQLVKRTQQNSLCLAFGKNS